MIANLQNPFRLRFGLAQLLGLVAVCGAVFAIWPYFERPPSPLERLPEVKLGMSETEVESLIGKPMGTEIGGGAQRATNCYFDGEHSAVVVIWGGEGVTEVRLDGKLLTPPRPPSHLWANAIAEKLAEGEQRRSEKCGAVSTHLTTTD
jgi:hypothetical protein